MENVCELAFAGQRGALAVKALCRCKFQYAEGLDRPGRDQAAMETLRKPCGRRIGRGAGSEIRRAYVRCRGQAAHAQDGGRSGEEPGRRHPELALDDGRNQETSEGEARRYSQQDRISGCLARLQQAANRAR